MTHLLHSPLTLLIAQLVVIITAARLTSPIRELAGGPVEVVEQIADGRDVADLVIEAADGFDLVA